jgi:oligosaccharide repeat unit polymerase
MSQNSQTIQSPGLQGVWLSAIQLMAGTCAVLVLCILIELGDFRWFRPSTLVLAMASICFLLVKTGSHFDLLHPVRIFGSLWCFCLSLASMRLLPIISDWNFLMWSCVTTGLISFMAGFWLAERSWRGNRNVSELVTPEEKFGSIEMPTRRTLITAGLCIATGVAVLTYEYYLIGGIPILADNVDAMRTEIFGVAGQGNPAFNTLFIRVIHFFVEFTKYGVFFAFIVLVQKERKSRKATLVCTFLILFGTLGYISQAGRMFLVDILITCVVLFHYLRRRIRVVELGSAVAILFILLGIAGSLRTQTGSTGSLVERVRAGSGLPEGQFWDGIGFGYLTLTESFEVFYRLTTDLQTTTRPSEGFLFYSLHRIVPRANIQEFAMNLYSGAFVTPTYMGEFYADYGIAGILIGSLVLGLLYGWVYLQGAHSNVLFWLYARAMFIQMVFFFPYVNLFSMYLNWIVDSIFMYFLIRFLVSHVPQRIGGIGEVRLQAKAS